MMKRSDDICRATSEAYLVMRVGRTWQDAFRLRPGNDITIGRDPANSIALDDDRCSRTHCVFRRATDGWSLTDQGSRNGTTVNGERIERPYELADGDIIRAGRTTFLFTFDISRRLDPATAERSSDEDSSVIAPPSAEHQVEILERKQQAGYLTESALGAGTSSGGVRNTFASLYSLVTKMVAAPDVRTLADTSLEGLSSATGAGIGAVLLFPKDCQETSDPNELRITAYRAPQDVPYHRVSSKLSKTALTEQQAVLAMDLPQGDPGSSQFETLGKMNAQSVICAPIRRDAKILGLLHLYSTDAAQVLDTEALEFALAVADQLAISVENLNQKASLAAGLERERDENRSLRRLLEIESDLVGDSQVMKDLSESIARVASSDAIVLVRGESGVGKELVARAIHFNSNRHKAPFVCINCAALTETLLESELFGHEKGSFTGATDRKIGKFERADNGTLFLDEVGEMPMAIQAKFLRVLEGHSFERVGGDSSIEVDVRVIAATNRKLSQAVDDGRFRKDLFYRLQILAVRVPPLREHIEDVPQLAEFFISRTCERLGRPQLAFVDEAMTLLNEYDWPGNVRELKNVVERAVVLCDGDQVQAADIHFMPHGQSDSVSADALSTFQPVALDDLERIHIARMMDWTNWVKQDAAKQLRINRSTLDRKLTRYGIKPPGTDRHSGQ